MKINEFKSIDEFDDRLNSLRFITRYQGVSKIHEESVAEHSFFVAAYIYKLYDFYEFDLYKTVIAGLMHDTAEVDISDVPYPVKADNKALADALSKAEIESLSKNVDEGTLSILKDFNSEFEASTPEGLIVALADAMAVYMYTKTEAAAGNTYMVAVQQHSTKRIDKLKKKLEPYARK